MAATSFEIRSKDFILFYDDVRDKFIEVYYPNGLGLKKTDKGKLIQMTSKDKEIWLLTDEKDDFRAFEVLGRSQGSPIHFYKLKTYANRPGSVTIIHADMFNNAMKFLGYVFPPNAILSDTDWCNEAYNWFLRKKDDERLNSGISVDNLKLKREMEAFWYFLKAREFDKAWDTCSANYKDTRWRTFEGFEGWHSTLQDIVDINAFNIKFLKPNKVTCTVYLKNVKCFDEFLYCAYVDAQIFYEGAALLEDIFRAYLGRKVVIDRELYNVDSREEFWQKLIDTSKEEDERKMYELFAPEANLDSVHMYQCNFLKNGDNWFLDNYYIISAIFYPNLGRKIEFKLRKENEKFFYEKIRILD
jgi:hypothetical protein